MKKNNEPQVELRQKHNDVYEKLKGEGHEKDTSKISTNLK
jgi:hypothetical protein